MKIGVLLPVFNEEGTIGILIKKIKLVVSDVVIVDDGSSDSTVAIAGKEGVHLINHTKRMGKGQALISGFEYMLKEGYDAVITMDGDLQHDPKELSNFIGMAQESPVDIIVGNRIDRKKSMPLVRRLTNQIMSEIISMLVKQDIPDSKCGYRLIKRNVLEDIKLKCKNFEIESEILLKAGKRNFKIGSILIKTIYLDRKSYINPFIDTCRFFALLLDTITSKD